MTHELIIMGCDDVTMCDLTLTDAEATFLHAIVRAVNSASNGGCQPTMSLELKA